MGQNSDADAASFPATPPTEDATPFTSGSAHEAWVRAAARNPRIRIIEPSMTEARPTGSALEAFMKEASRNPRFKLVSPSGRGFILAGWPGSKTEWRYLRAAGGASSCGVPAPQRGPALKA